MAPLNSSKNEGDETQLSDLDRLIEFAETVQENIKEARQKYHQNLVVMFSGVALTVLGVTAFAAPFVDNRSYFSAPASIAMIGGGFFGFASAYSKTIVSIRDLRVEREALEEVTQVLHETSHVVLNKSNVRPLDRALYRMRLARIRLRVRAKDEVPSTSRSDFSSRD